MDGVVLLTTVHPRGDTRITIKEARTLTLRAATRVWLVVADGRGDGVDESGRVIVHDMGLLPGGRMRRALAGTWRSIRAIRRINPRVVHFHDPELIGLGILMSLSGRRVVYDVHEDVPRQILSKHYLPWPLRRPMAWVAGAAEWCGEKFFHGIVPATPGIARRFPPAKTALVQNYPVLDEMARVAPVPYRDRPMTLLYPGVIAAIRGAREMVEAVGRVRDVPGVRLELAGTFDPAGYVSELKGLPGWERVTYHGEVGRTELSGLMGRVRAGLVLHQPIPNEIEAYPIKLFEYLSAGIPVIVSDFPVLRRLVGEVGCGIPVDPLNPGAIAEAMRWVLTHPDEAEAMGRRGRLAVEQAWNWEVEAGKLMGLYTRLLETSSREDVS